MMSADAVAMPETRPVLGCLMDAMAMIILTVPIIFPVITHLASTRSGSG